MFMLGSYSMSTTDLSVPLKGLVSVTVRNTVIIIWRNRLCTFCAVEPIFCKIKASVYLSLM